MDSFLLANVESEEEDPEPAKKVKVEEGLKVLEILHRFISQQEDSSLNTLALLTKLKQEMETKKTQSMGNQVQCEITLFLKAPESN